MVKYSVLFLHKNAIVFNNYIFLMKLYIAVYKRFLLELTMTQLLRIILVVLLVRCVYLFSAFKGKLYPKIKKLLTLKL